MKKCCFILMAVLLLGMLISCNYLGKKEISKEVLQEYQNTVWLKADGDDTMGGYPLDMKYKEFNEKHGDNVVKSYFAMDGAVVDEIDGYFYYAVELPDITLFFAGSEKPNVDDYFLDIIETTSPSTSAPRQIKVGDKMKDVLQKFPTGIDLSEENADLFPYYFTELLESGANEIYFSLDNENQGRFYCGYYRKNFSEFIFAWIYYATETSTRMRLKIEDEKISSIAMGNIYMLEVINGEHTSPE